jgi:TIR domain-containing protein
MADIFLSYAHEDLERARSLADALTSEGWAVFWDRRIPPGRTFEDYIEQHVRECRVLVVLWSPHASASRWVKIEAAIGRDRDILIPVLIVPATIPFGYAHLHAADLTAWSPSTSTLEYQELLSSIESLAPRTLPRSLVESKQPSTPASSAPSSAVSGSDEAPAASATPTAPPASLAPHSAVASQGPEPTRPAAERIFSGPTTQSQPVTKEELGASAPGGWLKDRPFSSESNVGFEQGGPGKASP